MDLRTTRQTDRRDDAGEDDPGRARATTAPTATPTAKTKTARLAISRPRKPNAVNEFDRSDSVVVDAT